MRPSNVIHSYNIVPRYGLWEYLQHPIVIEHADMAVTIANHNYSQIATGTHPHVCYPHSPSTHMVLHQKL